ncbi:MAG: CDP-alcohol phosphatidyltransferase family protein [Promethearchaeota archaeon]
MIDNWLVKTKIAKIFEKFVKKVFYNRISANQLTLIGLIIGLTSAVSIYLSAILQYTLELIILALILMALSFFFDVLDGILARLENPTTFGGILDIFCDRTVEVFIILALISTDPLNLMWPGLFSLAAIVLCITMFLITGGIIREDNLEGNEKVIYYQKGLIERSETFIFLFLMTILHFNSWRFILLWIFTVLVFITAILRLRDSYHIFNSGANKDK